jgi:preprotein translocase subunit SecY
LTGGAVSLLSVFALGSYPYLLATVVMSFLVTAIPSLGSIATSSVRGAQRVRQYIGVLATMLAVLEATAVMVFRGERRSGGRFGGVQEPAAWGDCAPRGTSVLGEGPEDGFDLAVSWAVGGLAFL